MSKLATSASDIPSGGHYAIIKFSSVYVPNYRYDEDIGGTHEPTVEYCIYETRTEWEQEIELLVTTSAKFKAIYVQPAIVKTTIEVTV